MAERPCYVVDASVAVRWYLGRAPFVEQAAQVLNDYREHRINLLAPDNLFLEVTVAIHQAVVARRIRASQGQWFVEDLLA
ncbi:MAG: hypothetical protein HY675_16540 [Chloroflexi bacterium]|nr:hypothetical protein [Chloroflexota bacterium]